MAKLNSNKNTMIRVYREHIDEKFSMAEDTQRRRIFKLLGCVGKFAKFAGVRDEIYLIPMNKVNIAKREFRGTSVIKHWLAKDRHVWLPGHVVSKIAKSEIEEISKPDRMVAVGTA